MTNYIIGLVVATIIYFIAIRYLREICPMGKFLKFVIYICISTVSLAAVNYIHPLASGEDNIVSSLVKDVSNTEDNINNDWQDAQQKANVLIGGGNSQSQPESGQSNGIKTVTFSNDRNLESDSNDDSNYVIIGRNGKALN